MDWKSSPPLRFSWLVLTSSEIQSTQFKGIRCQLLLFQRTTYRRKNVLLKSNLKWKCIQPGMFYRRKQKLNISSIFGGKIVPLIQVQGTSPSEVILGCRMSASIQPIYRLKLFCSKIWYSLMQWHIQAKFNETLHFFFCRAGMPKIFLKPMFTFTI